MAPPPPPSAAPFTPVPHASGVDWATLYELAAKVLLLSASVTSTLLVFAIAKRRRRQPLRAHAPVLLLAQVTGAWLMAVHVLLPFAVLPDAKAWCTASRIMSSVTYVLLDIPLVLRTYRLVYVLPARSPSEGRHLLWVVLLVFRSPRVWQAPWGRAIAVACVVGRRRRGTTTRAACTSREERGQAEGTPVFF